MPVKEVAQIGAAIGREFSYELIAAVAPMPQVQLDDALVQLSASGLAFRRGTPPDAIYTFKHALVQDAAYDSLLKSRRQELHGKIARVIEQQFPSIKTTEPEVLAHHLTAAGLTEAAIPLWQAAGDLALKRMPSLRQSPISTRGSNWSPPCHRRRNETPVNWVCALALAQRGWRSKAGPLRKSRPACIRPLPWRSRSGATMR
jgi:hypothetical protein